MRNTLHRLLCTFVALIGTLLGQTSQTHNPRVNINPAKAIKIKVFSNGEVMLNDKSVSLDQLGKFLHEQKGVPGVNVLYYRENAEGEPHPNALLVMRAVADARLPIRLCRKPDFSDAAAVDQKGR